MDTEDLTGLFHLPLSQEAHEQLNLMQELVTNPTPALVKDVWSYIWKKEEFIPTRSYQAQINHLDIPNSIKWLWESCCQLKHKFFFWLLLIDRVNTRAMLQKRQFHVPSYNCIMCEDNVLETRDHLIFHCKFAKTCWKYICPTFSAKQNVHANVIHLKEELKVPHLENQK